MKKMLIAATAVGSAIAATILYYQKKRRGDNQVIDAAKDAYHTINNGLGKLERPAHHSMG